MSLHAVILDKGSHDSKKTQTGNKLVRSSLHLFYHKTLIQGFIRSVINKWRVMLSIWSIMVPTQGSTAVHRGVEAAGVGVDRDVGGWGVQQRVSDNDWVDDALTGDGVEHSLGQVCWGQRHNLQGGEECATKSQLPYFFYLSFTILFYINSL